MVFVETSKAGCAFSLKIGIHMDEQGMLQGTRNKTGASQPLLSEGMVSSRVGTPFQRLRHFSATQSAMPSLIFMGRYSNSGGRRFKADPSVNRYVVRFNVEENARFLSMFEQSEAVNKAVFIKNFIFQKPFKIFVVNENTRIFINQLSSLNALYRTYGVSYNTLVKTLRENFSEKKGNAAIERLREATMRLVFVCIDSQELIK